jgi:hypothetical protein
VTRSAAHGWLDHRIDGSRKREQLAMTAFLLTFTLVPEIMEVV